MSAVTPKKKFPPWLKKRFYFSQQGKQTHRIIERLKLHTVCENAVCPNRAECFSSGVATFMILGDVCTRRCSFCAVKSGTPQAVDPTEPERISQAVAELGLKHVVITSVTRDDLEDSGASHFAEVIRRLKKACPQVTVEVLTPDFKGRDELIAIVVEAGPDIFNHNLETVQRLYDIVRPGADYNRSLKVLKQAKELAGDRKGYWTKSGLMLGLGETSEEIYQAMKDLIEVNCQILTLGQYLQPSRTNIAVAEFISPERFKQLEMQAYSLGFRYVASGPFVRSSYQAEDIKKNLTVGDF